jgi:MFS family permease
MCFLAHVEYQNLLTLLQASLLISLRGIFNLVNYLVVMPALSFVAAKYLNLHGKHRDHRLSQGSGLVSIIGFLLMGFAPVPALLICGLVVLSLGSAFLITARSLATGLVPPDQVGTLYSAIAISQSLGILIAGPLFAYLFRIGLHFGGAWMGLPFLQAGLFYVIATVAMWCIRVPRATQDENEAEPLLSE